MSLPTAASFAAFLTLTVLAPALGGAQSPAGASILVLSDPQGDINPPADGAGSAATLRMLDIRSLTITGDNYDKVDFELVVDELQPGEPTPVPHVGYWITYRVNFTVGAGNERTTLVIEAYSTYARDDPTSQHVHQARGTVCTYTATPNCQRPDYERGVQVHLDDETNSLRFSLKKYDLVADAQLGAQPDPAHPLLPMSTTLKTFTVQSSCDGPLYCRATFRDNAASTNADPAYPFREAMGNLIVRVTVAAGYETLALLEGRNQSVAFSVINLAPEKRVVDLSYLVEGDDASLLFRVTGPRSVSLPSGQSRNYTFSILAPEKIPENEGAIQLTVLGVASQFGDVGADTVTMRPGIVLAPSANRLRLVSTSTYDSSDPATLGPASGAAPTGFLTTDANDPRAAQKRSWDAYFGWATPDAKSKPLAEPMALDPKGRVTFTLEASSYPAPLEDITMTVVVRAFAQVAAIEQTISVPDKKTTLTFSTPMLLPEEVSVVPAGEEVSLRLEFRASQQEKQAALGRTGSYIKVESLTTFVDLPVMELPESYRLGPNPSPFQVSALGEREDFANPGKTKLFNVSITNGGLDEQRLRVVANATEPGWAVQLLPASRFDLPPGAEVKMGLLVHVPANASQNDRGHILLTALADDETKAVEHFLITVLTKLDLPDEGTLYAPDEDDLEHVVQPRSKTPAPGTWMGLLALVSVALTGKRRRLGR